MAKKSKQQIELNKKKRLANLRPAKKGEVRNPEGGRTHNPLLRAFVKVQQEHYREALQEVLDGDEEKLNALCEDPTVSSMKKLIAVSMRDAIKNERFDLLERIAERLFGKIPDKLDLTAKTKATSVDKEILKSALKELDDDY